MNDNSRVVTLPCAEEIVKRLKAVDLGIPEYSYGSAERFYSLVAEVAVGEEISVAGVPFMLALTLLKFTKLSTLPKVRAALCNKIPCFIDALIIEKKDAEEAKRLYHGSMEALLRKAIQPHNLIRKF